MSTDVALWFSPDGMHIAFPTINDTLVPEATITKYGTPGDIRNQYPFEEKLRYPKVLIFIYESLFSIDDFDAIKRSNRLRSRF